MGASAAQLRVLLDLLGELHDCRDELQLRNHLTDHVSTLVPADLVSLNYIDMSGTNGGSLTSFNGGHVANAEITKAFDAFVSQHPLVQEMVRTGVAHPRRMSDFISLSALRRLDLYHHVFAPLSSTHQLAFSVGA